MPMSDADRGSPEAGPAAFTTTHWSVVLAARGSDSPQAAAALDKLCRSYWPPLYFFVRRRGHTLEEAQDLTQEFFARLLQRNSFATTSPAKGRFRSFLLASLKNFLVNQWEREQSQKRGGGHIAIPLDAAPV